MERRCRHSRSRICAGDKTLDVFFERWTLLTIFSRIWWTVRLLSLVTRGGLGAMDEPHNSKLRGRQYGTVSWCIARLTLSILDARLLYVGPIGRAVKGTSE
jgi:hypothetical protein